MCASSAPASSGSPIHLAKSLVLPGRENAPKEQPMDGGSSEPLSPHGTMQRPGPLVFVLVSLALATGPACGPGDDPADEAGEGGEGDGDGEGRARARVHKDRAEERRRHCTLRGEHGRFTLRCTARPDDPPDRTPRPRADPPSALDSSTEPVRRCTAAPGNSLMMLSAVTDLPLPDSPTRPSASPPASRTSTPSTARTTPPGVTKCARRF